MEQNQRLVGRAEGHIRTPRRRKEEAVMRPQSALTPGIHCLGIGRTKQIGYRPNLKRALFSEFNYPPM